MSVALQSSDRQRGRGESPDSSWPGCFIRRLAMHGIFWRGAIYVLLPVGATLILIGAMLDAPGISAGGCTARLSRRLAALRCSDFLGLFVLALDSFPGGSSRPVF